MIPVSALAILAFPAMLIGGLWKLGANRLRKKHDGVLVLTFTAIGLLCLAYGLHLKAMFGDQLFGRGPLAKDVTSWFQIVGFSVVSFMAAARRCIPRQPVTQAPHPPKRSRPRN